MNMQMYKALLLDHQGIVISVASAIQSLPWQKQIRSALERYVDRDFATLRACFPVESKNDEVWKLPKGYCTL